MTVVTSELRSVVPTHWKVCKLSDVAKLSSGTTPSRSDQARYFDGGSIPWVKTGDLNNGMVQFTEEKITQIAVKECSVRIYPPNTVLVAMYGGFRQIGRTGRLASESAINQALSALQVKNGKLDESYLQSWLNAQVSKWKRFAASSRKDPNITGTDVAAFPIAFPPLPEQQKIAAILLTWDRAIDLSKKLLISKQRRQQALIQQLFTGKVRLPGFKKSAWKKCHLDDVAKNSTRRNGIPANERIVYSVTNSVGMVPMDEGIIGESIDRYKAVSRFDFAYNPMRINVGSIAMWDGDEDVLVSPDYVVFSCGSKLDAHFLNHFRRTHYWRHFVNRAGGGSVRVRIYFSDLGSLKLNLPSIEEQRAIANVLNTQDLEIALQSNKLDALKQQKKGLMQQLLTGKLRIDQGE